MLLFVHQDRYAASWQLDALERSIRRVGQHGDLLVASDRHPRRHEYVILDRVLAFARAMEEYRSAGPVAILDPDMVMVRRFAPNVRAGVGQASDNPALRAMGHEAQMEWACAGAANQQHLDLPWVLSAEDAVALAPAWLEITERAVADPSVRSLLGWCADMWTYQTAAFSLGISHDVSKRLAVVPGIQREVGDAWVVHFCRDVAGFDKRTYEPGLELAARPDDPAYEALRGALA